MDVLIIVVSVMSVFLVSGVIVYLDPRGCLRMRKILKALIPTLIALPFAWGFWWLYSNDFALIEFTKRTLQYMQEGGAASNRGDVIGLLGAFFSDTANLLGTLFGFIGGVLINIVIVIGALISVPVAAWYLVPVLPDIVALPFHAIAPIMRGIGVVAVLPVHGVFSIFTFFTRPPSLRTIQSAAKAHTNREEALDRAAGELMREREKVKQNTRNAVKDAYAHHHRRVAEQLAKQRKEVKLSPRRMRSQTTYDRAYSWVMRELAKYQEVLHHKRRERDEKKD